jgi:hypothetical protein
MEKATFAHSNFPNPLFIEYRKRKMLKWLGKKLGLTRKNNSTYL